MSIASSSALSRAQPDAIEVELIRSLFDAFVGSLVLSIGFVVTGVLIVAKTGDSMLLGLLVAGAATSVIRLAMAAILARKAGQPELSASSARRLERLFAIPYFGFAALLGLFGCRTFLLPAPEAHMLMICLLVSYCAGVAIGIGLRPRIAVPSMILALVPAIVAAPHNRDIVYWAMSVLAATFLAAAFNSLHARHGRVLEDIGLRLAFANLARQDALTALPNRLALREWYEARTVHASRDALIAVHYIDLNGFKPVNDNYGHPVGDALLIMVGKRIAQTIRDTDIAARLGGDEFAVIQYGIRSADEAATLAGRLAGAIARPFRIGDHTIRISTGLGYVIAEARNEDLDQLLGLADEALYTSKRSGGVVTQYDAVEPIRPFVMA